MLFFSGPRQVGKTTVCKRFSGRYFNWDNDDDKLLILAGPKRVAEEAGLMQSVEELPTLTFDEIHRYPGWKQFLKGFFDTYGERAKIIVTGSARLDFFRCGGDSLMGRYFPYRMHPFSVGELVRDSIPREPIGEPVPIVDGEWEALLRFGGFPEPFSRRSAAFSSRWNRLRISQLVREDMRDLSSVGNVDQLAALARILSTRSGEQIVWDSLGREVRVSENTAKSWTLALCALHHGFLVRPWHHNVSDAIRKTPKWYLRDWALIGDEGKRSETFVACHLLKAVEGWTDLGLGEFDLWYLRDKRKREVDFVVTRDGAPWFLVEVKASDRRVSPNLEWGLGATGAEHAFQVSFEMPFQGRNPFLEGRPVCVSARTLLSQLM